MKDNILLRLLKMFKPYVPIIVIAGLCVLLVNAAQLAKPYVIKTVIDDFLLGGQAEHGFYSISFMGILYLAVIILGSFLSYWQVVLMNYAAQQILSQLRREVFSHIQHMPLRLLDRFSTGRLITRATNDVEALNEMFTEVLITIFKDVLLLIGIIVVMFRLNTGLAIVSLVTIPLIAVLTGLLKGRIKTNFIHIKSLIGRINGFMSENISGMKIVQIFHCEKLKLAEFITLNDEYNAITNFQIRLNSLLRPGMEVFQTLAVAIIIWYAMDRLIADAVELGVVYAFTSYIKQFFNPISELADNYTTIQSAIVSADRIFELLDCQPELEDMEAGSRVGTLKGDIEFKNVFFAYQAESWILKDVSFCIKAGETAAFVGETGAGKTTIISLLSRFYPIQRGEILIDGINIQDINLRDLRRNIGVVLQDVFLFAGNIRSNIDLNAGLSEADIEQALEISCAAEFVHDLPEGIYEPVVENGRTFSAGQRQLLSLARAIAHKPAILVLDEATSSIDTKTELLMQQSIANIAHRHTMLVIAHRLSTVKNADKIILLKWGEIIEIGSHDELIERGGYYKELYDTQAFLA